MTGREPDRGEGLSPWFTAGARVTRDAADRQQPAGAAGPSAAAPQYQEHQQQQEQQQYAPAQQPSGPPQPQPYSPRQSDREHPGAPDPARPAARPRARDAGDTAVMPAIGDGPGAGAASGVRGAPGGFPDPAPAEPLPPGPGRAERRRAAAAAARKGRGRGRRQPSAAEGPAAGEPGRPLTRVEARRAAKAAKDSPAVIASRAMGELFITCGVVMLLFVTYQLWWTNVRAGMEAGKEKERIQQSFTDTARDPGAFRPGEGFAIMYIPKLDVVVPVAEGIDKKKVLDRGMVGRYAEGRLKTAMPSDRTGNFGVAGHRNTHGEPFRYINRLKPGDPIVVETRDAYYTYEMASILPQTAPSNVAVLDPVPRGSGFTGPGRYITLTTCTPEFTSTYRMIVWGRMVEERPRSKGKPDALVG